MVTKVISELKSVSRLKIFPENGPIYSLGGGHAILKCYHHFNFKNSKKVAMATSIPI